MPKYKFRRIGEIAKVDDELQESSGGIMSECGTETPIEHVLSADVAVSYPIISFLAVQLKHNNCTVSNYN